MKKNKINKERIYDSMLDAINYNVVELDALLDDKVNTSDIVDNLTSNDTNKPLSANQGKVLNDTTAKLAVSNVFTQPQQVPNATLPQHTTNLSQVETMFEMFKRELRGYNFAMPDLTGKTEISTGVYRLYDLNGITLDYNVTNGEYILNGTAVANSTIYLTTLPIIEAGQTVSRSTYYVSGSIDIISFALRWTMPMTDTTKNTIDLNYNNNKLENTITDGNSNNRRLILYILNGRTFDNFTFKLQLEKGSTANPYTVPGEIPQFKDDKDDEIKLKEYDKGYIFSFDEGDSENPRSDMCFVKDELWTFSASNDEHTDYKLVRRYNVDFVNKTSTLLGEFEHNWGHTNSVAYCEQTDCLIMGNGSNPYGTPAKIFIFPNASSFKDLDTVDIDTHAIIIDTTSLAWGDKLNVVWGEHNREQFNICYCITNDGKDIRKVLLGQGINQLEHGTFISGKTGLQFNGTFKVLEHYQFEESLDVVQGAQYYNNKLYCGMGHSSLWYVEHDFNEDVPTRKSTIEKFYNADGTLSTWVTQGITFKGDYLVIRVGYKVFVYRI